MTARQQNPATDAELQAAWAERRRADWPPTFDAVMAHPLLSRLVRVTALATRQRQQRLQQQQPRKAAAHSPQPPSRQPFRQPAWDARRAAANDLETPDDDDHTDPRQ